MSRQQDQHEPQEKTGMQPLPKGLAGGLLVGASSLIFALTACGPNPDGGSGDNGDGGTSDASALEVDGGDSGDGGGSDEGTVCNDACNLDDHRCNGDVLEVCIEDSQGCKIWDPETDCVDNGQYCDDTNGTPTCLTPETCDDGVQNQDETDVDCGGVCDPCEVGSLCVDDDDCTSGACTNGTCMLCHADTYHCFGNYLRICANDESSWNDVQHCNPLSGVFCDQVNGTCSAVQAIGNGPDNPTGTYFLFAHFTIQDNPEYLGGYDVDCLQDHCFVNRDGNTVDEYEITLLDSDGDGELEPNQHPDNPDNPGPVEERQLTHIGSHSIPIGHTMCNELYITQDTIYFMNTSGLNAWDRTTEQTTLVAPWTWDPNVLKNHLLGFDDVHGTWYTGLKQRVVFSWDDVANEWVTEFSYPNLAGDHADGLEVVTDPNSGLPYVYVSDMTSDFIGQYLKHEDGHWEQVNLFQYNETNGEVVEGMGFGALSHFWICGHGTLYEIGGGDLSRYTGDWDPTHM